MELILYTYQNKEETPCQNCYATEKETVFPKSFLNFDSVSFRFDCVNNEWILNFFLFAPNFLTERSSI